MLQQDGFSFYFSGFCFVLLLLLGYLIVGVVSGGILLALLILYVVGGCLKAIFDDD